MPRFHGIASEVRIHIGGETYLAFDVVVLSHDASRDLWADTWIGRCCFVGARSIILPGVRIGVAENPARIIRRGIEEGVYGVRKQPGTRHRTRGHVAYNAGPAGAVD